VHDVVDEHLEQPIEQGTHKEKLILVVVLKYPILQAVQKVESIQVRQLL
jgi:hypothetical protein